MVCHPFQKHIETRTILKMLTCQTCSNSLHLHGKDITTNTTGTAGLPSLNGLTAFRQCHGCRCNGTQAAAMIHHQEPAVLPPPHGSKLSRAMTPNVLRLALGKRMYLAMPTHISRLALRKWIHLAVSDVSRLVPEKWIHWPLAMTPDVLRPALGKRIYPATSTDVARLVGKRIYPATSTDVSRLTDPLGHTHHNHHDHRCLRSCHPWTAPNSTGRGNHWSSQACHPRADANSKGRNGQGHPRSICRRGHFVCCRSRGDRTCRTSHQCLRACHPWTVPNSRGRRLYRCPRTGPKRNEDSSGAEATLRHPSRKPKPLHSRGQTLYMACSLVCVVHSCDLPVSCHMSVSDDELVGHGHFSANMTPQTSRRHPVASTRGVGLEFV